MMFYSIFLMQQGTHKVCEVSELVSDRDMSLVVETAFCLLAFADPEGVSSISEIFSGQGEQNLCPGSE